MARERLREGFEEMVRRSYDEPPDAKQKIEMRRVFMGGAQEFLAILAETPAEQFQTVLDELHEELERFGRLVKNGVA